MIRPQPRLRMPGNAKRVRWKGADRLTASARSQSAGAKASIDEKCRITALFTKMSTPPPARVSSRAGLSEAAAGRNRSPRSSAALNRASTSASFARSAP